MTEIRQLNADDGNVWQPQVIDGLLFSRRPTGREEVMAAGEKAAHALKNPAVLWAYANARESLRNEMEATAAQDQVTRDALHAALRVSSLWMQQLTEMANVYYQLSDERRQQEESNHAAREAGYSRDRI